MLLAALLLSHEASMPAPDATSAEDLWPVVMRCQWELAWSAGEGAEVFNRAHRCWRAAERLAWSGDDADRSRLWDVYDTLPADGLARPSVLKGFMAARLADAVAELRPGPETAEPVDIETAQRLSSAVEREYAEAYQALQAHGAVAVQSHWPDFHAAVADFLRGRSSAGQALDRIGRFAWGGFCGTFSDLLHEPQHAALMLAYLSEGRTDLAAGALLRIGERGAWSEAVPGWDRRILEAAGLDWETLYVGALMNGRATAEDLGRRGSDRSARLLLAARDRPRSPSDQTPLGDDPGFLSALAAFVRPGKGCSAYGTWSSSEVRREATVPSEPELERQILEALAEKVRPDQGEDPADAASHSLLRLCRTESRQAFRVMTTSPFSKVRQRGVIGLEALGEKAAPVAEPRPVAFRITVDGRPLAGVELGWELTREGQTRSSVARSDKGGVVRLERDPFVDPKQPVQRWALEAPKLAEPGDVWLAVGGPTPANLDAVTDVEVATQSLTLVLRPDPGPATVTLQANSARSWIGEFLHAISRELRAEPGSTLVFARLQRGREYRLDVVRADGTRWESERIALGDVPVVVEMRKGAE